MSSISLIGAVGVAIGVLAAFVDRSRKATEWQTYYLAEISESLKALVRTAEAAERRAAEKPHADRR